MAAVRKALHIIENEIMIYINTCRRNGISVFCFKIIAYDYDEFYSIIKVFYSI